MTPDLEDRIISYILTYSDDNRQIGSLELYNRFGIGTLKGFQRRVANIIKEFQDEEFEKADKKEPFILILSTNEGYYIPKSYDGALAGLLFYQGRIMKELARRKQLKNLIKKAYLINPDSKIDKQQMSMEL